MAALQCRDARDGDLPALIALYEQLAERPAARPCEGEAAREILAAIIADDSRRLVVAELDGALVGSADLVIALGLSHGGKPWAIVEHVIVADHVRRQGVGSELMRHLIDIAELAGCYKLQLLSGKQRIGAHGMYRNVGFEALAEGFRLYFDEEE
jgi:GNAT superfamily N-acetyltransferase